MPASTSPSARSHGFTLVEVMVAASVLIVGILGTFTMVDQAGKTTRDNNARTISATLSREILEQARALDYEQLAPATMVSRLRTRPGLEGRVDAQGRWIITRRGIDMIVTPAVCTFDDPMDGVAAVPPANPCPAAPAVANAPVEANPDDFRRVSLTFTWNSGTQINQTTHTSQIANPGGGRGPRIVSFPDPFALQVTAAVNIPFVVNTSFAASVRWTLDDGVHMGDAYGGPSIWGFNWDIGTIGLGQFVVDGTYTASVQPFDSRGVPGEMRVSNVMLNRRVPFAPAKVQGGRSEYNGGVVELEWAQNPERDVIGYRVYRLNLSGRNRICPPSTVSTGDRVITATACTDPDPGAAPIYNIVAVDRPNLADPTSGTREGDVATYTVPGLGLRPSPPTGLTANVVEGRVKLQWTPPGGLPVLFYRIYRNGQRLDRTVSLTPEYVDRDPYDGQARRYTVSAVSALFNESVMSNEVVVSG